jgi:hypothetical protein
MRLIRGASAVLEREVNGRTAQDSNQAGTAAGGYSGPGYGKVQASF